MRPKIEEFQNYLTRLFPEESRGKSVRSVTVQVTDNCNLRCGYCYQINKQHHVIAVETAKRFLDLLLLDKNPYINRSNSSGMILDFIGGEPFLAVDVMDELTGWVIRRMIELDHPWLHRFRVSISSNGTLYFQPEVQAYLHKYKSWIALSISIDGNRELHDACRIFPDGSGSYDLAVAAARHWMDETGQEIGSKVTLCPANVEHTCEAIKNLIGLGYRSIFCNCVFEEGWEREHAGVLYRQLVALTDWLEEHGLLDEIYISIFEEDMFCPMDEGEDQNWCGGTGDMIAVDYKGDIFPCLRYMESSLGNEVPPIIIGTVAGGIEATEEQRQSVKCLKCITRRTQSTEECYRCPIAKGCAWCSAYNYQSFGTADHRATFICEMHHARALANLYFWSKYYRFMGKDKRPVNHVTEERAVELIGAEAYRALKLVTEGMDEQVHQDHPFE